ncbi:MAG: class I SAM-dependent methyltransferase [Deltaproteobacteria bacterium]|nr:class I SAM-dependent methyltransferase [Deltaproteobacteria bacterium]
MACIHRSAPLLLSSGLVLACGSSEPHHHGHHGMPHRFDDAERWSAVFDDPERDEWQQPDLVVSRVVTRPSMRIVDLGAGTGYFTLRFARAVPDGEVIAVDLESTLLRHIDQRASKDGLSNVRTWLGAADDPQLDDWRGKLDRIFLCNTYHHIPDRPAYFAKLANLLTRDGRIVIVDFRPSSPKGPPRELKVSVETVVAEMEEAGLVLVERYDGLPDQYLLELQKR